ncbi:MAG TPA: hypothetical protein VKG26_08725 [Bacteroidia bacterium]|nr:hypothetical protein [Bacteroidia bacterium]
MLAVSFTVAPSWASCAAMACLTLSAWRSIKIAWRKSSILISRVSGYSYPLSSLLYVIF